jgi:hypothetical protein
MHVLDSVASWAAIAEFAFATGSVSFSSYSAPLIGLDSLLFDESHLERCIQARRTELDSRRKRKAQNQLEAAVGAQLKRRKLVELEDLPIFADVALALTPRPARRVWLHPIGWSNPNEFASDPARHAAWMEIVHNEISHACALRQAQIQGSIQRAAFASRAVQTFWRRRQLTITKHRSETPSRARSLAKLVGSFVRRNDKDWRKKAERDMEAARRFAQDAAEKQKQTKKLEFLISQTEIYSHFMANKMASADSPVPATSEAQQAAMKAIDAQKKHVSLFDQGTLKLRRKTGSVVSAAALQTPFSATGSQEVPQPQMLNGHLKSYQLKGLNWMANLYSAGINGILACVPF